MGQVGDIIKSQQDRLELPVDVNDILAEIKKSGVEAEIEFIGVELDTMILRGKYRLFEWSNGIYSSDVITMANIYYNIDDDLDWQRFVCCKEITHLLDGAAYHTSKREDQVELARQVGLPAHMRDPFKAPVEANIDVIAELFAVALLLPMAARNKLFQAVEAKKLSVKDVAFIADIPERYVAIALAKSWPDTYSKLIEL
jgi:hypothetical protein